MMKYPIPVITFLPPCLSFYHHLLLVFFVFPLPANKISEEGSRVDGGGGEEGKQLYNPKWGMWSNDRTEDKGRWHFLTVIIALRTRVGVIVDARHIYKYSEVRWTYRCFVYDDVIPLIRNTITIRATFVSQLVI